jgi:hypothetical protein
VFPGDTLHLFAGFTSVPQGETRLTIRDAAGRGTSLSVPAHTRLATSDLLPRLAAAHRLSALPDEEAKALAVRYQLATQFTSFVVVAKRAAGKKAKGLPATVTIPHMLAAGWGGTSHLGAHAGATCGFAAIIDWSRIVRPAFCIDIRRRISADSADLKSCLEEVAPAPQPPAAMLGGGDRARLLQSIAERFVQTGEKPRSIDELAAHGLSREVQDVLRFMVGHGEATEPELVAAVLALLGGEWLNPDFIGWLQDRVLSELSSLLQRYSQVAPDPTRRFASESNAYGQAVAEEVLRQLCGEVLSRREFRTIRQLLRERVLT